MSSVIQFDDISAMMMLCPHTGRGESSTEEQWLLALLPGREPPLALALTIQCLPVKSVVSTLPLPLEIQLQAIKMFCYSIELALP